MGRGEGNDEEGSEEMVVWGAVRKQETGRERKERKEKRKERVRGDSFIAQFQSANNT